MPDVSVLIVTWNSSRHVGACLRSLLDQPMRRSLEVIIADNASSDGTPEIIERTWPQVRLIRTGGNLGFSPAMNLAQASASGRYLLWLNPDTAVSPAAIDELADSLDACPDAGAAGPLLLLPDGSRASFCARQFPSLTNAFIRHCGLRWAVSAKGWFGQETFEIGESTTVVDCLLGAAMMVPRAVAAEIGLLGVAMPMYFEDLDYCARITTSGRRLLCVPSAVITHDGAHSTLQSGSKPLLHAMEVGHAPFLYLKKFRGASVASAFRLIVLSGNLARTLILLGLTLSGSAKGAGWRPAWNLVRWALTPSRIFEARVARHFASPAPPAADP